ncbi:MAG: amino acid adenylation domain-containing protein [Cyanobacteria bacterium P01_F01_bin.150]
MSDQGQQLEMLRRRINSLPPEKRTFFIQQLKQKGLSVSGLISNLSDADKPDTDEHPQARKNFIQKRQNLDDYPLSYAQERLWFLYQLDPNNPAYNIGMQWHLFGDLDLTILQKSFTEIVQRHEVLRTSFGEEKGQPKLTVQPTAFSMPVVDIRPLSLEAQAQEIDRLTQAEINRPFDLTQPPLLRVSVIRSVQKAEGRRQKAEGAEGAEGSQATSPKSNIQNLKSEEPTPNPSQEGDRTSLTPRLSNSPTPQLPNSPTPQHTILLTLHHIVGDGWSRGILLKELSALYRTFSQEQPSPLGLLPIQYADFAAWQRQWLQGHEREQQLEYWRSQLHDIPMLELPTDHPRPPAQTFDSATASLMLPLDLLNQIKELSQQEGTTVFITLLAAFKILLHRYTDQDDIVVGVPTANRNWTELEGLIGFFVNSVVVRSRLQDLSKSAPPTIREVVRLVRSAASSAFQHQDLPFAQLVEELQPERSLSHNPLFQVMFQFQNAAYQMQNAARPELQLPGLTLEQQWLAPKVTKFDLTWHTIERDDGLLAVVEYCTELFDGDRIQRMLGHFKVLLESIVTNPDQRLSEVDILTADEQHHLVVEWNQTSVPEYLPHSICSLFEEQVEQNPGAMAVRMMQVDVIASSPLPPSPLTKERSGSPVLPLVKEGLEGMTYQELNIKANQLSHYLRYHKIGSGDIVGICLGRTPNLLVAILAVLKTGAAYLPLDPTLPDDRLRFMVTDAECCRVIVDSASPSKVWGDISQTRLDVEQDVIRKFPSTNLGCHLISQHLAYVMYTSGSTGTPKGTMITHRGLVNYLRWSREEYRVTEGTGAPVQSSIGFDATITSLLLPLVSGQTVTMLPEEDEIEALSEALLVGISETSKIGQMVGIAQPTGQSFSLAKLTPAHLKVLELLGSTKSDDALRLSPNTSYVGANAFVLGGEALTEAHLAYWRSHAPNTRLINEYGPTETVVGCCVYDASAASSASSSSGNVPIGRPIANAQLYILDRYLNPVPVGIPGELYIGGAGVARGYHNRPDLTGDRFIPNPFLKAEGRRQKAEGAREQGSRGAREQGSKGAEGQNVQNPKSKIQNLNSPTPQPSNSLTLYRTGDRAFYRPDGTIEYLGRIDNQVKLRGFRIELGEIEATLVRHPEVEGAIATLQHDDQRGSHLVAHITFASQQKTIQNPSTPNPSQERDRHVPPLNAQLPNSPTPQLPNSSTKIQNLKSFLKDCLPSYMIPAAIVPVESFPLTANGKIDRTALPTPDWEAQSRNSGQSRQEAQTDTEKVLVDIWSEVLGVKVGTCDNFFELGGDSILSIQIIARAKQAGLTITPRQLFQHQTVAELAAVAAESGPSQMAMPEQGAIAGVQEWLPIYHWFFEQNLPNPHHYNQSLLLELQSEIETEYLAKAWTEMVEHHDALRLRFSHVGWVDEGNPTKLSTAQDTLLGYAVANPTYGTVGSGEDTFLVEDLTGLPLAGQEEAIAALSNDLQASLDLSACLCRCVLFQRGANQKPCLLIIVHHLVVDGLSWRVLLADLELAYRQQQDNRKDQSEIGKDGAETIALPPKTTSFQAWGEALVHHAQSSQILEQRSYWQQLAEEISQTYQNASLQSPMVQPLQSTAEQVTATLDNVETQNLLTQMPSVFNTRVDEVMLTALVQTLGRSMEWSQTIGLGQSDSLVIDLEGYGRDVFDHINDSHNLGLDVSRTVGWFTSIFPVMLTLNRGGQPGDALKSVKEQLRQIPKNGTGYGLLRYLHPDTNVRQSVTLPRPPKIKFNYLGQLDLRSAADSMVKGISNISPGTTVDPNMPRLYALEINSFVRDGQLQTQWNYSREQYAQQDIEPLVQRYMSVLRSLLRYGQTRLEQNDSATAKEYTPSDFEAARLNQQQLDQVLNRVNQQKSSAQGANQGANSGANQGTNQSLPSRSSVPQSSNQTSGRQRRRRR